jgi:ATP-dependent 26S proteasome regulatory subunit
MPTDETLGASLAIMMQELSDTIDRTADRTEREQLLAKQDEVHKQLQPLIDKTVKQNIAEYKQATAAVEEAIKSLKETQQQIGRLAKIIEKLAVVVNALAKLASMV